MKEKLKKFVYRIRYITEFASASVLMFFLFQLIYKKAYYGYFEKDYIIGTVIWFLILLINFVYNLVKSENKIEKIFLNIAIPAGLMYLVFMMPGHIPDEPAHFWKAYDFSQGNLSVKIDSDGKSYITVPKSLLDINNSKENYWQYVEALGQKTDYSDTTKVISSAQGNWSGMYLFSGIGFAVARGLNLPVGVGMYFGKVLNFAFFLVLAYFAIRRIPFGKLVLAIYMVTPMNLQQVTSISPDAFINAITLFYIAFSISLIFKKEKVAKKEIVLYILMTMLIGVLKFVYILLAGVGFLIIKRKDLSKKQKIGIIILTVILGGAATIGMYIDQGKYSDTPNEGMQEYLDSVNVSPERQAKEIKENPEHIAKAYFDDWYGRQKEYMFMAIGSSLGWIEVQTSETIILLYFALLILACFAEKSEHDFNKKNKIWLFLIFAGVVILVEFAMYLASTSVGGEYIGGVQGRYFIPVYILLLLCLYNKDSYIKIKHGEKKLMVLSGLFNVLIIAEIIKFFIQK